ncbi:GldG family protein [Thermoanaerobacterium butyriciformans]|uniref:ABC-type uncharacterized transport system involved in gliding motility auxiliary subunit n=1 Tax=Thermoanaerobacterium butyriciformans TaxID=1702242 RepID=A0ABS4NDR2_9THEO|nr:GldG family protein [Thermoanaerobacterium butyriciformans]MBP2071820.1 ABC-type uncharacterized transport system involved in gliding motility auxiliary subunit [Thermoanaerobacterium butyriciformans]
MNKIRLKYGSNTILAIVILLGILIFGNLILAQKPIKWDLTKSKQYTLSDKTKQVLKNLKTDVTVYAFFQNDSAKTQVQNILNEYTGLSKKIKVQFIDPDKNPSLVQKYGITAYDTTLFLNSKDDSKRQIVNSYDIFTQSQETGQTIFNGEQQFTQAIINVTEVNKTNAYIIQGHNEVNSTNSLTTFKTALQGEGYNVNDLNIGQSGGIPKDAGLIIIANPQMDYNDQEINAIMDYLKKGGKAFIMMGAENGPLTEKSINNILANWNVKIDNDIVVDPSRNYFMDALSPVPEYGYHDITDKLESANLASVAPSSRSITYKESNSSNISIQSFLTTSDKAWGKTNFNSKQASFDDNDIKGPLTLGVTISDSKTGMKVVVLGNDLMATDKVIGLEGNRDLLMNSANWLTNKTTQISISPKPLDYATVFMTGKQANAMFIVTVIVIPLVIWIIGGFVFFRRRAL